MSSEPPASDSIGNNNDSNKNNISNTSQNPASSSCCSRNNHNCRNQAAQNRQVAVTTVFKGDTEAMNGHVFQAPEEAKDPTQFIRMMEALRHYCTMQYSSDLSSIFAESPNKTLPSVSTPIKPDLGNGSEFEKDDST